MASNLRFYGTLLMLPPLGGNVNRSVFVEDLSFRVGIRPTNFLLLSFVILSKQNLGLIFLRICRLTHTDSV